MRLQVIVGGHLRPVMIDAVALREVPGDARFPADRNLGHPSFGRDGSMIVTACYGGEFADMLVLVDPQTGAVTPLCSVPMVHGRSHETGTHMHPCWAPDGLSVVYDSDETGHWQLYQVFVPR